MNSQKALVVDDEFEVRKFVTNLLTTQLGFSKVTEAQSAEIALKMFEDGEKFDLVFSDWEMPRMKGDEFLKELRKSQDTARIPFIMMSYKKDKESLVQAIQSGVTNYIVKPLTAATFIQKVKKTISDVEKKEVENFTAAIKSPVEVRFDEETKVTGALLEVSDKGCKMRMPHIKRGYGRVYDTVQLAIKFEGTYINVEAEVSGVREDTVDSSVRLFVIVDFRFQDMDQKVEGKIERLVTNFHVKKLDDVKADKKQEETDKE